jgi:hypothetical protein
VARRGDQQARPDHASGGGLHTHGAGGSRPNGDWRGACPGPPAAPTPQPSKPASDDSPLDAFSKNISKGDVDDFLKEMPGLRKKFGF